MLSTATFITTGQIPINLAKAAAAGDRQDTPLITHPREPQVLVRADKVTKLERFITIVGRVRGLGFRQVSLEVIRM